MQRPIKSKTTANSHGPFLLQVKDSSCLNKFISGLVKVSKKLFSTLIQVSFSDFTF
jgi:hypothetical protein